MGLVVEELETRMEQEPQATQGIQEGQKNQKNLFANSQEVFKGLSQGPFTLQLNSSAKN